MEVFPLSSDRHCPSHMYHITMEIITETNPYVFDKDQSELTLLLQFMLFVHTYHFTKNLNLKFLTRDCNSSMPIIPLHPLSNPGSISAN